MWLRIIVPDAGAIGPGKIDLLRSIEKTQSISAAARDLDMSYRRAWMLLDETRRILGRDVIATHAGGADRGGAALTEAGRNLIAVYDRVCTVAAKAAESELQSLSFAGPGEGPPASAPRKKRKSKVS
ncbi:MAG: ModE family transcriptional regulator [Alphaproteobacteria bacterium]